MPRSTLLSAARRLITRATTRPSPSAALRPHPQLPPPVRNGPPPAPTRTLSRVNLAQTATHWTLSFPQNREANTHASNAGFVFNLSTRVYETPLATVDQRDDQRARLQSTVDRIDQVLDAHAIASLAANRIAAKLRTAHPFNLNIQAHGPRIRITAPPSVESDDKLRALGGRRVASKNDLTYFSFPPIPPAGYPAFAAAITALDASIPPPPATKTDPAIAIGPGLHARNRGHFLLVQLPPASIANDVSIAYAMNLLGAREVTPGAYIVRTDIRPASELFERLKDIADAHARAIVPPTTPRNGVFLDARDLETFLSYAPSDISLTPRALSISSALGEQMREQFGNLRAIAGSPRLRELSPSQVDLVRTLASKLETLRYDLDHIANVQDHNATRTHSVAL